MKLQALLKKCGLQSLKFKSKYLEAEWKPTDADQQAAWELYVELVTRITTQPLTAYDGDEKTALDSVYALFPITRDILKSKGRHCAEFTKIAVVVLNQIVRPFTATWHKESLNGAFQDSRKREKFREELGYLQKQLRQYVCLLSEIAEVEDLTDIESS